MRIDESIRYQNIMVFRYIFNKTNLEHKIMFPLLYTIKTHLSIQIDMFEKDNCMSEYTIEIRTPAVRI